MKLISKYSILGVVGGAALTLGGCGGNEHYDKQPVFGTTSYALLEKDGLKFKDMNRNGALDPYEDWRLTAEQRADDLVARMTLDEKAGLMMHGTAPVTNDTTGVGT